jgi:PLP dependent protein
MQERAEELRENLAEVQAKIEAAAQRAGRSASEIKLIAVSKTFPAEILRLAIAAGATDLGENKVQEAEQKVAELGRTAARWHLIGNLQANKARKAVRVFDVIHTLDSIELANRLERICNEEGRSAIDVLIQVDLAGEATKSGIPEKDLPALVETLRPMRHLKLKGLMLLPPFDEDVEMVRPYFRRLREIRDELHKQNAFADDAGELSMGMSHDFETAIEEGATMVRVGTAIFGARKQKSQI